MLSELVLARIGEDELKAIVICGGLLLAFVAVVASAVHKTVVGKQRELTRRELAAYVAEGSMSSDDAAKLMADNAKPGCGGKQA